MTKKHYTQAERDVICQEYRRGNTTLTSLAKRHEVSEQTIRNWLAKNKLVANKKENNGLNKLIPPKPFEKIYSMDDVFKNFNLTVED